MSIASQCSDCCTCPTPTFIPRQRRFTPSLSKSGFSSFVSGTKIYLNLYQDDSFSWGSGTVSFSYNLNGTSNAAVVSGNPAYKIDGTGFSFYCGEWGFYDFMCPYFGDEDCDPFRNSDTLVTETSSTVTSCEGGGVEINTLTNLYTDALLLEYTLTYLSSTSWQSYTSLPLSVVGVLEINDSAGMDFGINKSSAAQIRYAARFLVPQVGSGQCYRLTWVERFIPDAGVGITSVEVVSRGVYRPIVTLSAPPSGGTLARAVAVMSSSGEIASIRILNSGSGYTSLPTVTIAGAINGGTSSTGWTATLSGGRISAISGGSSGNYLPTLAFSGGGGADAAATCTLDEQGGINAVTLTASGSAYAAAPSLTISPKVPSFTSAVLHLHLGIETAKCGTWDGIIPDGYSPSTPSTYPTIPSGSGYFECPAPASPGIVTLANVRSYCECSACP
jgi:hypothetical protein